MIIYVALALIMFGVMITVHEAGHFFAARLMKIPVREFAIGFGPALLSWNSKKHETKFFLRLIPVGGYCAFYAEDDITGKESEDERAFSKRPALKRLFTVLMGPVMNVLLAFIATLVLVTITGVPEIPNDFSAIIREVDISSPADVAGLKSTDIILEVEGTKIDNNLTELLNEAASKNSNNDVTLTISRLVDGVLERKKVVVNPIYSKDRGMYILGITLSYVQNQPTKWHKGDFGLNLKYSVDTNIRIGASIIRTFGNLIFKGEGINELTGIVGVTKVIAEETQQYKLEGYLSIMISISINLAIINLLPFPGLDGSRALFLIVEAIRGKPIKKEAYIHVAGMILLFALMILITFIDIIKLF